jgi:membrane-bound serine protease (ClpP class)
MLHYNTGEMIMHLIKKIIILPLIFLFLSLFPVHVSAQNNIVVLTINGVINPASAEYLVKGIQKAANNNEKLVIIQMDTPGGLDTSMRIIIKEILNSKVPIAVYVAPGGSRAASAGTFITYAGHVAAMAPGTNIGAAHPVNLMGGGKGDEHMMAKVENDAVAYIKSIAEKRKRNAVWAELAVRKSVSISETEAKNLGVIDLIANDIDALIMAIDGKEVTTETGTVKLDLKGASLKYDDMKLRQRILDALSNPNVAYILMLMGMAGLYFELSNPGLILPGVVGAISLILAFYAFQTLPINYAGLLLILFGIILFIAEIKVISYGLLSVGGVISMFLGSLMLMDTDVPYMNLSLNVIIPTVLLMGALAALVVHLAIRSHKLKVVSGMEGMVGETGTAETNLNPGGKVFLHGEHWAAEVSSPDGDKIKKGGKVVVENIVGLKLIVKKLEN